MTGSAPKHVGAVDRWRTDGFAIVEDLIDAEAIAAALAEVRKIEAPPTPATNPSRRRYYADDESTDGGTEDGGPAFRSQQFSGTVLFPIPDAPHLNRLFVHPALVGFAEAALGTEDIRIYQSRIWSKYQGRVNYSQPLHQDRNHSLVPTRSEPGWWHLECFLYLTDVTEATGAPQLVPRSAPGGDRDGAMVTEPDDAPDLYAATVSAEAPAGSLLAYRSDVWHRGVDIIAPGAERHVVVVAFKPAGLEWIGYDSHPPLAVNADFAAFVAESSPRDLALFGFPPPGHAYWTEATLDATARLYPGLDLGPWRENSIEGS